MRIIIDARSFGFGGLSSTLLNILENLDYRANEYAVIGNKYSLSNLKLPCKIIHDKAKPKTFHHRVNYSLSKVINSYDCYLTVNDYIPRGININSYIFINNMACFDVETKGREARTRRRLIKRAYKIAKKIFTVSEFSKSCIIKHLGTKKEVIVVRPSLSSQIINSALKQDNVFKKQYVVYIGPASQHKNLDVLFNALNKLDWKYPLHIITQKHNISKKELKLLRQYEKKYVVLVLDNLSPEEYSKEISEAKAVISPSSYEGFSLPILEALYYNTPVIASSIDANLETFKDSGIYFFNPNDTLELSSIIDRDNLEPGKYQKQTDVAENVNQIVSKFEKSDKKIYVKRNFIFNVIYQLLVVLTPLITAPYIARVLGVSNLGRFSFAYTIAYYFVVFGYLGFQQYAQRAIAESQYDKEEQTRVFWQIIIVRLIPVTIGLSILFIFYALNIFGEYSSLILILSIMVAGTAVDINFYFHGKENFFIVMIINLTIRIVFLASIFLFIKSPNDLGLYTLLYALMIVGGYLSMWLMLPTNLRKVKLTTLNFKEHLKHSLSLFLPVAAVSIYAMIDKTLIGVLVHGQTYQKVGYITIIVNRSDYENGMYYQAERMVRALFSVILAFGTVMTTRNSIEYKNNRIGTLKKNIYKSFQFVFALGVPLALGTVLIANSFVPLYFGEGYDKVAILLMIYSPIILLIGISNIFGMQLLLPTKRDKQYSISVLFGFAINIIFNCILIPFCGSVGAVVGTLISEFSIALIQYMFVRNKISLTIVFKTIYKYIIAGVVMLGIGYIFYYFVLSINGVHNVINLIVLIPASAGIYYLLLLILKDRAVFAYSTTMVKKIKHAFIYMKYHILNQSDTMSALLALPGKQLNSIKKKEMPIIKDDKFDEK